MTVQLKVWHIVVAGVYLLLLSTVMASAKMVKATNTPPPKHSCEDLYRSRDYGAIFGNLFIDDSVATIDPYCTPAAPPPARPQPRR